MRHLDLFSGIGGFALATEMVWDDVEHIFCDFDPFCQAILKKHWPHSLIHGDIKKLDGGGIGPIDLLTGGFPCQPFSTAGKRKGTDDARHLWPEMLRVIREVHPRWIIGENVGGLLTWSGGLVLEGVLADLEDAGYEVVPPFVIPAAAIGAPHRRDRVWIIAHAIGRDARRGTGSDASASVAKRLRQRHTVEQPGESDKIRISADASSSRWREGGSQRGGVRAGKSPMGSQEWRGSSNIGRNAAWEENWPSAVARLCSLDDGLPGGLARPRGWRNAALKGAGNAIVPQVAAEIMRAIKAADEVC